MFVAKIKATHETRFFFPFVSVYLYLYTTTHANTRQQKCNKPVSSFNTK